MDLKHCETKLARDLSLSKTIIAVASCEIEYWGRSRSVIGTGDRIIMLKPDSTIIIHSPKGFKPINWMSPPADTTVALEDGKIKVFAQRTVKPFEEIRITMDSILHYCSFEGLSDREKLELTHTEKDMRDYLEKNPMEVDPGFRLKSVEYKTTVGLIDLYGKIGDTYCVVELKAVKAGLPAVLQLKRYMQFMSEKLNQKVAAILMAPSIAKNPKEIMKKEGMRFKKFNVHDLEIKREKHTLQKWIK